MLRMPMMYKRLRSLGVDYISKLSDTKLYYLGFRIWSRRKSELNEIASIFNQLQSSKTNVSNYPRDFFTKCWFPWVLVVPMQIMGKRLGLLGQDSMSKLRDTELDLWFRV